MLSLQGSGNELGRGRRRALSHVAFHILPSPFSFLLFPLLAPSTARTRLKGVIKVCQISRALQVWKGVPRRGRELVNSTRSGKGSRHRYSAVAYRSLYHMLIYGKLKRMLQIEGDRSYKRYVFFLFCKYTFVIKREENVFFTMRIFFNEVI